MTPKGLTLLAAVTLLVVVGAALSLDDGSASGAGPERSGPLLPDLMEQVNDVARIEVETPEESYVVGREDGTWGLESRGGYPVKFESVKQLLVGMANLEVLMPKTPNPELHGRLGLQDPDAEDARSKRVTLADESGNELASLVVGDTKWTGSDSSVYVRRTGEDRSYQCAGSVSVPARPLDWVDRKVLQLGRERVRGAVLESAEGGTLTLQRTGPDEANYALAELPPTRELTSPSAGTPLATWATYLSLDDVRPADEVDFSEAAATLETRTFDGLVVRATTAPADGKTWARFEASYEAPPEPVGPEPPAGSEEESADDGSAEEAGEEGPDEEAVRAEVREVNERLGGWAFALPSYKADLLAKTLEDLLAPLPEEEPAEEPTDEGAAPIAAPAGEEGGGESAPVD